MAQLSFDKAFNYLKEGGMVTREKWTAVKGIFLKDNILWTLERDDSKRIVYTLSYNDIFGDDWVFVIGENTDNETDESNSSKCRPNTKCNQCHSS